MEIIVWRYFCICHRKPLIEQDTFTLNPEINCYFSISLCLSIAPQFILYLRLSFAFRFFKWTLKARLARTTAKYIYMNRKAFPWLKATDFRKKRTKIKAFQTLNARPTIAENVEATRDEAKLKKKEKHEKRVEWYQINICLLNVINNGI